MPAAYASARADAAGGRAEGTGMRAAVLWFALAAAGQAAALQLIDAGTELHYQHTRLHLLVSRPWVAALIAIETLLVAYGLRGLYGPLWRGLRRLYAPGALAAIAAAFVLSSSTLSSHPADYATELALASFLQLLNLGAVVLAAAALPAGFVAGARRRAESLAANESLAWRAVMGGALFVTVVCGALAYFVWENHPHIIDEVGYFYHARYLAAGKLSLPLPPVIDAFRFYLIEGYRGHWYVTMPPGWPAVLALGMLAGVPWLVNPLLAGLNILLAYALLKRVLERSYALAAVALLCVSPWNLFMGMNFMTHTLTLTCTLAAVLAVVRYRSGGNRLWVLPAGAACGAASLIRPLDGLIIAGVAGLWLIAGRPTVRRLIDAAAFALAIAAVAALILPYNRAITGDPLRMPLTDYFDRNFGVGRNDLGFGANRGLDFGGLDPFPGHGLRDVAINANMNTFSINVELLGWSTGSLVVIFLWIFSGRLGRKDWAAVAAIAAVVAALSLYWFSGGPDFGARYWFLAIVPLTVLVARGLGWLSRMTGGRAWLAAAVCCALSLAIYIPWRATDKYFHYRNMRADVRTLAKTARFRAEPGAGARAVVPGFCVCVDLQPARVGRGGPDLRVGGETRMASTTYGGLPGPAHMGTRRPKPDGGRLSSRTRSLTCKEYRVTWPVGAVESVCWNDDYDSSQFACAAPNRGAGRLGPRG